MGTTARIASIALLLASTLSSCAAPRGGAPEVAPPPLRVVSYNIKHGRGMDDAVDLARTAAVLRELDADVILLQEVDEVVDRSGDVDEAAFLGEALGMEHRFCTFMDYQGGRYGLAALSRLPILRTTRIDLPDGTSEPRAALALTVQTPTVERIRIVNCHLDWKAEGKRRQAQARVLHAALAEGADRADLTLLGGDLNAPLESPTLDTFTKGNPRLLHLGPEVDTFPSDEPTKRIDHFLSLPADAELGTVRTWVVPEAVASDHRPVVLELWAAADGD